MELINNLETLCVKLRNFSDTLTELDYEISYFLEKSLRCKIEIFKNKSAEFLLETDKTKIDKKINDLNEVFKKYNNILENRDFEEKPKMENIMFEIMQMQHENKMEMI